MKSFEMNLINHAAGVIDALQKLNKVSDTLTLFVLDENDTLVGTLTDGDIRRGLIDGLSLSDPLSSFMKKDFHAVIGNFTVEEISRIREKEIILLPEIDENKHIVKVHDLRRMKSILPLECVLMAGGRGERLRPLTDKKPKPMLMLGNKPIIEHNIDRLIQFGIEKIYISINYLGDQIRNYFGDGSQKGIEIVYIEEEKPMGTAGALSLVDSFKTDYILLMNSDLFTDVDFEELYLKVIDENADMGIGSIPYNVSIPYAIFDEENKVVKSIKEKPIQTNYANAGIYIFRKEWVNSIPENTFYDITDLISDKLNSNSKIIHDPIIGYWIDIGKPEDYKRAQEITNHLK